MQRGCAHAGGPVFNGPFEVLKNRHCDRTAKQSPRSRLRQHEDPTLSSICRRPPIDIQKKSLVMNNGKLRA